MCLFDILYRGRLAFSLLSPLLAHLPQSPIQLGRRLFSYGKRSASDEWDLAVMWMQRT